MTKPHLIKKYTLIIIFKQYIDCIIYIFIRISVTYGQKIHYF